jgi:RNA polymerase sigma-70 factor (ECF subfamily)
MLNISRNLAIDKIRSKEINKEGKTSRINNLVHAVESSGFDVQHEDAIGVKEILKGLPEDQQFVVEQLYFKGYSQSEVAEEFNIPLGTVKTRLRLAMNQLRSSIKLI